MSERCEVVVIHTPLGPTRINADDYDKAKHVLWEDKKPVVRRALEVKADVEEAKDKKAKA